MDPWPALTLVGKLLSEHALDRVDPRLVPCVHEHLPKDVDLLRAAAQRYNGALFNLSAPVGQWEDPTGPLVPHRADVVRGIVSAFPSALPAPMRFDEPAGRVRVTLEGVHRKVEPSLVPVLRAASLVGSSAYDVVDLVVICVDMDPADPTRAALLWSLLTVDPRHLQVIGPKTVAPIFGGRVDPDIDYARDPEVRLVVRSDRVLRRANTTTHNAVQGILADRDPLVLFLGAGASASSGIPLGNTYRDGALRDLLDTTTPSTGPGLVEAFFEYLNDRDRFLPLERHDRTAFVRALTLERVLRETFHELGPRPRATSPVVADIVADCDRALGFMRPGRRALHHLADVLHGRLVVVSVNFDQLIEVGLSTNHLISATPEEFKNNLPSLTDYLSGDVGQPIPILKLHGSIERPETLIATIDDTQAGLHDDVRAALDTVVKVCRQPVTWVWIGCSMRDRDINAWLGGLARGALNEWWVDPLPSSSLDDFFEASRRASWDADRRKLQDRLVVESADRFLRQLDEHAATLTV